VGRFPRSVLDNGWAMSNIGVVDDTLTTREAADRLGVPLSTFHNFIRKGRIEPARKLSGRTGTYLFHPAAVDALRQAS
jgi:excisionase family DNA binding protein